MAKRPRQAEEASIAQPSALIAITVHLTTATVRDASDAFELAHESNDTGVCRVVETNAQVRVQARVKAPSG